MWLIHPSLVLLALELLNNGFVDTVRTSLFSQRTPLPLALRRPDQVDVIRDLIIEKLPPQNYNVLKYLIEFLNLVR